VNYEVIHQAVEFALGLYQKKQDDTNEWNKFDHTADSSAEIQLLLTRLPSTMVSVYCHSAVFTYVCSFGASIIDVPEKSSERQQLTEQTEEGIKEYVEVCIGLNSVKYFT
jgi:hypothetical protein